MPGNVVPLRPARPNPDRLGVIASVLCAIHCAATPILLLFAPAFGRIWSHPASHWLVALLVVPLAAVMVWQGFRRHRRPWIVVMGGLGMGLVVTGAAIPYLGIDQAKVAEEHTGPASLHETPKANVEEEEFVYVVGQDDLDGAETPAACADTCCPSVGREADGNLRLHIPLASIVTTLGGLALIVTHLGNLCCCCDSRNGKSTVLRLFRRQ